MADYFSIAPGSSSYTTTSYLPQPSTAQSYGSYGAETVTTTTTPVVNTQVLGTGVETNFGTNTADGFFGGDQAMVSNAGYANVGYTSDAFFGGDSSQVVTTAEPIVTRVVETVVAAPPPAPTYQNYNAYQDYNTGLYDYAEPAKKASFCNLRNILLGLLGLLLLAGLLGGLLWALKLFRRPKAPIVSPTVAPIVPAPILKPGPSTVVIRRDGYTTAPMVVPVKPQTGTVRVPTPHVIKTPAPILRVPDQPITQPLILDQPITQPLILDQPITQPVIAQQVITQPVIAQPVAVQFSQDQMNAAIQAAVLSGAYRSEQSFEQAARGSFRQYFSSEEEYNSALHSALSNAFATQAASQSFGASPVPAQVYADASIATVPTLSASDLQQLLLISNQQGGISPSVLSQLGLTQDSYNAMLQQAVSTGVLNQSQLGQLGFTGSNSGFGIFNSISQAASRVGNAASNAIGRLTG